MKAYLILIGLVIVSLSAQNVTKKAIEVSKAQLESITANDLKKHLSFIASDELRGRETGTHDFDVAARYMASHLESFGYTGLGENGSFFQTVPLIIQKFDYQNAFMTYKGKKIKATFGKDFSVNVRKGTSNINISLSMVTVGTGAIGTYKAEDVKGKAVIRFDAPKDTLAEHRFVRNNLITAGANIVINVLEDSKASDSIINLYNNFTKDTAMGLDNSSDNSDPVVYILVRKSFYKQLLSLEGKKSKQTNTELTGKFEFNLKAINKKMSSKNVVAYLKGSDPTLNDQFVGYGSHLDHIGTIKDHTGNDSIIFNGADDDGSGSVSVLEIAKAIALNPPRRSTFIIFHTGEEKGLLGSEYYSEHPLIPIEKTIAVINIDMIGSYYQPDTVQVIGADRISQDLHDINVKMNNYSSNLFLDFKYNDKNDPNQYYFRSDHYNYARKGIPIIFFYNDNPKHYHKSTDDVATIDFNKMAKIARLALATGYYVQNQTERIKIREDYKLGE